MDMMTQNINVHKTSIINNRKTKVNIVREFVRNIQARSPLLKEVQNDPT